MRRQESIHAKYNIVRGRVKRLKDDHKELYWIAVGQTEALAWVLGLSSKFL